MIRTTGPGTRAPSGSGALGWGGISAETCIGLPPYRKQGTRAQHHLGFSVPKGPVYSTIKIQAIFTTHMPGLS
jgi:hypothetical protein